MIRYSDEVMTEPSAPSFHSDDPEVFERDGAAFAHQAVQNDQAGQFETAAFYYNVREFLTGLQIRLCNQKLVS